MAPRTYRLDEVAPALTATLDTVTAWLDAPSDDAIGVSADPSDAEAAVHQARRSIDAGRSALAMSAELAVAQLVDLVVAADDLARSAPDREPPTVTREALRIVVRSTLDLLEARAPGRSVEVRVPPFAAVQCIDGPRHTRGTPANTIEADPTTWIRLAAGRLTWAQAVSSHRVSVSGLRADLGGLLPLL